MGKHRWKAGGEALKGFSRGLLLVISAATAAHGTGGTSGGATDRSIAREIARWNPHIEEASARFGIPQDWIRRVMRAESGGRTALEGHPITSSAGAMGVMQLMPGTWAEMRSLHGLGPDPHDPHDSILAGTAYLHSMYDRFGYPGLFAAYNAGPARYAEYLANGRPLPAETVAYVAAAGLNASPRAAAIPKQRSKSGIFISLALFGWRDIESPPAAAVSNALFVHLSTASAPSE